MQPGSASATPAAHRDGGRQPRIILVRCCRNALHRIGEACSDTPRHHVGATASPGGAPAQIPSILAALCGLRRGEITALRWRSVNLSTGQLTVREFAAQSKAGVHYKEPKSGRARTVALSASVTRELNALRVRQAEELFKLGIAQSDDLFVVMQAGGKSLQPNSLMHEWVRLRRGSNLTGIRLHDLRHAHATHPLSSGVHPKSPASVSDIPQSALRLTSIRMCCRVCRRTRLPSLTVRSARRNKS